MNYNHGRAQKEFELEWVKTEAYYRENGMTEEQIAAMYEFDLEVFRSNRRYKEHTVPFTNHNLGNQALYEQNFEHYDENNWLEALPEEVSTALRELPEDQLKAFYLYRVEEYTQQEIAVMMSTWQQIISIWIVQIDEILQNHCKTGGSRRLYYRGGRKNASKNLEK